MGNLESKKDVCMSSEDIMKELEGESKMDCGVGFSKSVPFSQAPPFFQAPAPQFRTYSKGVDSQYNSKY